jgi:hypothetical protein
LAFHPADHQTHSEMNARTRKNLPQANPLPMIMFLQINFFRKHQSANGRMQTINGILA